MAIIGRFRKDENGYSGTITTLIVQTDQVHIVAEGNRLTASSPSHRIYAGDAEIGQAWPKTDKAGVEFLNLKLDDPSFPGPIYPMLMPSDDAQTFVLVWTRSNSTRVV